MGDAERRWADQLAAWAIPDEIRAQAPGDPWKLTPALFRSADPAAEPADTPSRRRGLEALDGLFEPVVLDVGCGGGAAAFALVPPASLVIGVDEGEDMLEAFAEGADARGVQRKTFPGRWPDVARAVPVADVVVSNHVFYNVPDLAAFALALTAHARRRVVVEISGRHPVSATNPLWKHFWGLDRPEGPTADDAVAVLVEAGIEPSVERDLRTGRWSLANPDRLPFLTRRLCLPPEREPEVAEALARWPQPAEREAVTLWWEGRAEGPG